MWYSFGNLMLLHINLWFYYTYTLCSNCFESKLCIFEPIWSRMLMYSQPFRQALPLQQLKSDPIRVIRVIGEYQIW